MKRRRRTEILIEGDPNLAAAIAGEIEEKNEALLAEKPNAGLVMVRMKETARLHPFYIGEVFVTECKVQLGGQIGLGIAEGDRPELSYHLAVIDAAYKALPEEVSGRWTKRLLEEEEKINVKRRQEAAGILKTKVSFETMDAD